MNNLKIIFIKIYLWKILPMYNVITEVEITDMTAKVDPNRRNITQYHAAVKIAYGVDH
jgi:hypothetical protein